MSYSVTTDCAKVYTFINPGHQIRVPISDPNLNVDLSSCAFKMHLDCVPLPLYVRTPLDLLEGYSVFCNDQQVSNISHEAFKPPYICQTILGKSASCQIITSEQKTVLELPLQALSCLPDIIQKTNNRIELEIRFKNDVLLGPGAIKSAYFHMSLSTHLPNFCRQLFSEMRVIETNPVTLTEFSAEFDMNHPFDPNNIAQFSQLYVISKAKDSDFTVEISPEDKVYPQWERDPFVRRYHIQLNGRAKVTIKFNTPPEDKPVIFLTETFSL